MLADRPKVEQAAQAVFSREGSPPNGRRPNMPAEMALELPELHQAKRQSRSGYELHVQTTALGYSTADSHALGDFQARNIALPDVHELAAGKLAALLARGQARDLFDCHRMLTMKGIDRDRLRLAFVVYGGMNRKDWRTVSIADVEFDSDEVARLLIPTLNRRFMEKQAHLPNMENGL